MQSQRGGRKRCAPLFTCMRVAFVTVSTFADLFTFHINTDASPEHYKSASLPGTLLSVTSHLSVLSHLYALRWRLLQIRTPQRARYGRMPWLDTPISDSTHPDLRSHIETNKTLLRLLAFHSAMRPNLQQTYMTPANIKSKVYFMWDFVGRTLGFAYMLSPALSNLDDRSKDIWFDIKGRSFMTAMLLLDDPPGRLDAMVDMSYPGQTGELPFGVS
ncbi:hypothetical protein LTR17_012302 [Elasticomyces elasticus]|nr:hypothetical protein LTR17_012302 [Elasticomyces elasticus]